MDCERKECVHYGVCSAWRALGNDNYINQSNGSCNHFTELYDIQKAGFDDGYTTAVKVYDRHASKWVFEGHTSDGSDMYVCPVCKRSIITCSLQPADLFPFCHCGADMRGKYHTIDGDHAEAEK